MPLGEGAGNEARNRLKAATISTSTKVPSLLTGRETSYFAYMDCDDAGPSHFHKVIMVPLHPTLVQVKVGASNTLIEPKAEPCRQRTEREGGENYKRKRRRKGREG